MYPCSSIFKFYKGRGVFFFFFWPFKIDLFFLRIIPFFFFMYEPKNSGSRGGWGDGCCYCFF